PLSIRRCTPKRLGRSPDDFPVLPDVLRWQSYAVEPARRVCRTRVNDLHETTSAGNSVGQCRPRADGEVVAEFHSVEFVRRRAECDDTVAADVRDSQRAVRVLWIGAAGVFLTGAHAIAIGVAVGAGVVVGLAGDVAEVLEHPVVCDTVAVGVRG